MFESIFILINKQLSLNGLKILLDAQGNYLMSWGGDLIPPFSLVLPTMSPPLLNPLGHPLHPAWNINKTSLRTF